MGSLTAMRREPTLKLNMWNLLRRKKILAVFILPVTAATFLFWNSRATIYSSTPVMDPAHPPAKRILVAGVGNAGEVTPMLWRGAQPTHEGFQNLAKSGVAIVVDLRFEGDRDAERRAVTRDGMEYAGIPWSCHFPQDQITARFLQLVRDNPRKKIFVHCEHGIDRTGMMIAAYRMAEQGWSAEQARQEMIAYGRDYTHQMWCRALGSYEADFPRALATSPDFAPLRAALAAPVGAPQHP
jgi:protein tyrosine phosphatase (PTP) superfamily phosphohydrolase (DUF442 family)